MAMVASPSPGIPGPSGQTRRHPERRNTKVATHGVCSRELRVPASQTRLHTRRYLDRSPRVLTDIATIKRPWPNRCRSLHALSPRASNPALRLSSAMSSWLNRLTQNTARQIDSLTVRAGWPDNAGGLSLGLRVGFTLGFTLGDIWTAAPRKRIPPCPTRCRTLCCPRSHPGISSPSPRHEAPNKTRLGDDADLAIMRTILSGAQQINVG